MDIDRSQLSQNCSGASQNSAGLGPGIAEGTQDVSNGEMDETRIGVDTNTTEELSGASNDSDNDASATLEAIVPTINTLARESISNNTNGSIQSNQQQLEQEQNTAHIDIESVNDITSSSLTTSLPNTNPVVDFLLGTMMNLPFHLLWYNFYHIRDSNTYRHHEESRPQQSQAFVHINKVSKSTYSYSKSLNKYTKEGHSFPTVTLYFDCDKRKTVAVLSKSITTMKLSCENDEMSSNVNFGHRLASYLHHRIQDGTALQRSPLYYELDGFIRWNYTILRQYSCRSSSCPQNDSSRVPLNDNIGGYYENDVAIAVGALDESDQEHLKDLYSERNARLQRLHGYSSDIKKPCSRDFNFRSIHESNELPSDMSANYNDLFEKAINITYLHRLESDLDVFSIFCMQATNNTVLCKIATQMIRNRFRTLHVTIRPFVDGIVSGGSSTFVRGPVPISATTTTSIRSENSLDATTDTIAPTAVLERHFETDRTIEYQRLQDLQLAHESSSLETSGACCHIERTYFPRNPFFTRSRPINQHYQNINYNKCMETPSSLSSIVLSRFRLVPVPLSKSCISWNCDEFLLPNLHCREWGDIFLRRDYVGQKMVIRWHPDLVDQNSDGSHGDKNRSDSIVRTLAVLRLDTTPKDSGQTIDLPIADYTSVGVVTDKSKLSPLSSSHFIGLSRTEGRACQRPQRSTFPTSKEAIQSSTTTPSVIPSVTLHVHESQTRLRDPYETLHSGFVQIEAINLTFLCLVRAYARSELPRLLNRFRHIETLRPLLQHEREFLELMNHFGTTSSHSTLK